MNIKIYPSKLSGTISIPPSKSITHRALICASLSVGESIIYNPLISSDTLATISCLKSLGVNIEIEEEAIIVKGVDQYQLIGKLDAKDSASTIRFLIPIIAYFYDEFIFYGSSRLMDRLQTGDLNQLKGLNFIINNDHIVIKGKLDQDLNISEGITSQFISGLLLSLPLRNGKLNISKLNNPYIILTLEVMKTFGVQFINNYSIGKYQEKEFTVESDFSSASFFIAMMLGNKEIKITNLNFNSFQGDKNIILLLEKMGAKFIKEKESLTCIDGQTKGMDLDLTLYPDLVPIIATVASISTGVTKIKGIRKLKYKESNRIKAISKGLIALGADINFTSNSLIIKGKKKLEGNRIVSGEKDHRIVMSFVTLCSLVKRPFIIEGCEYVYKSFPDFFSYFTKIGGKYESRI